ncbi:MAG: hypothetical protein JO067_00410 [Cupriavidus sp.]|nr:hypothetical protein [Cupriavidus sp.]
MSKPIGSRKVAAAYSDIDALAQHVDGFDARHYFDQQGEVETSAAVQRWPLLASVMGLSMDLGTTASIDLPPLVAMPSPLP